MTNKEAAEYIKNHTLLESDMTTDSHTKWEEVMLTALKALEREECEDAISRQAVIDMTGLSEWFDSSDSYNEFVIALSELPSVNPQPKTGHWIEYRPDHHTCSNCNKDALVKWNATKRDNTDILTKYCPNCGYRMVEPQESEDKG